MNVNSHVSRSSLDNDADNQPTSRKASENNGSGNDVVLKEAVAARVVDHGVTKPRSLKSYVIERLLPKARFIEWEERRALKSAHKHLHQAIHAVASGKLLEARKASAKVAEALQPLTDRKAQDSDLLERLCAGCLLHELPTLSQKKLENLESGLATRPGDSSDRVLDQIEFSLKAELLQRKLAVLDGSDASSGKERLGRSSELRDILEFASTLIAKASNMKPAKGTLPGTRYTLEELFTYQMRATDALNVTTAVGNVEKKKAAKAAVAAAKPATSATTPVALARKQSDAPTALTPDNGANPVSTAIPPQKKEPALVAESDEVITRRLIGPPDDFKPKALSEIELVSTLKAIAAQGHTHLPQALADAAIAVRDEIELRKSEAKPVFQAALQMAIGQADAPDAADLLLLSFAKFRAAATLYGGIGERLRYDEFDRWIGEVLDAEQARGDIGVQGLQSLQKSLTNGEGKVIQDVLSRPTRQMITPVLVAADYLRRLGVALNARLPVESVPAPQRAKGVRDLTNAAIFALRRHLHVEPQRIKGKPFIDLEPSIQKAKDDLAWAWVHQDGVMNADGWQLAQWAQQISLLLVMVDDAQQISQLRDLAEQLQSADNLDDETAQFLQDLTATFTPL